MGIFEFVLAANFGCVELLHVHVNLQAHLISLLGIDYSKMGIYVVTLPFFGALSPKRMIGEEAFMPLYMVHLCCQRHSHEYSLPMIAIKTC